MLRRPRSPLGRNLELNQKRDRGIHHRNDAFDTVCVYFASRSKPRRKSRRYDGSTRHLSHMDTQYRKYVCRAYCPSSLHTSMALFAASAACSLLPTKAGAWQKSISVWRADL